MDLALLMVRFMAIKGPDNVRSHRELNIEYLFYTFNTFYFFLSIAIITSKYSYTIYNSKTQRRL